MAKKKIYKHHQRATVAQAKADAQARELVLTGDTRQVGVKFDDGVFHLLTPFISVEAFGAVCDGITDDNAAIKSAIIAANAIRVAKGIETVSVVFPPGLCNVGSGVPLVTGIRLCGCGQGEAKLITTGSNAVIYTATLSGSTFTDNLGATLAEILADKAVNNAGIRDLSVEQQGTMSGNAGSGAAWDAAVQLVGCPSIRIENLRGTLQTDDYSFLHVTHAFRTRIDNAYVTRGGAYEGGKGIWLDSTTNASIIVNSFVFGDWDNGIKVGNPDSVTIIETNVEFTQVGILVGGSSIRIIGGYYEGNVTDIQLGVIGATGVNGWVIDKSWHGAGTGNSYGIYLANCQSGEVRDPFFEDSYAISNFRSGSVGDGNEGNTLHLTVNDATNPDFAGLGLNAGRNMAFVRGAGFDDWRSYEVWQIAATPSLHGLQTSGNLRVLGYANIGSSVSVGTVNGDSDFNLYKSVSNGGPIQEVANNSTGTGTTTQRIDYQHSFVRQDTGARRAAFILRTRKSSDWTEAGSCSAKTEGYSRLADVLNQVFEFDGNGFTFVKRFSGTRADVSSANDTVLPANYNRITGNTTINGFGTASWNPGAPIQCHFVGAPLLKHNTAPSAGYGRLWLVGTADYTAIPDDVLNFTYDGTYFREWKGR